MEAFAKFIDPGWYTIYIIDSNDGIMAFNRDHKFYNILIAPVYAMHVDRSYTEANLHIPVRKHSLLYADVIKWKCFPRYCPFVRGIHQWSVDSPHKGEWCGALMFPTICAWTNGWANISKHRWFYTPSRSLWLHCNEIDINLMVATYQMEEFQVRPMGHLQLRKPLTI